VFTRVDGGGVITAASHLMVRSEQIRAQLAAADRLPRGLTEPALSAGMTTLADVTADVLELVSADLALLVTKVRAGVVLYDRTERSVARASGP
jgi:hypothetical protein